MQYLFLLRLPNYFLICSTYLLESACLPAQYPLPTAQARMWTSLLIALTCAVAPTLQTKRYFGLIVGALDQGDMSENILENIVHQHSTLEEDVSVKAIKPAFDQVFDYVMKLDINSDDGETEEALQEQSGLKSLETLLEANNGILLELVMSETEFEQKKG